jgi:hypothetical protein
MILETAHAAWEVASSTVMRKWKWLFVKGYECKRHISTAKKFLNSCQGGRDTWKWSAIVLKSIYSSPKYISCSSDVMASLLIVTTWGTSLTYWASFATWRSLLLFQSPSSILGPWVTAWTITIIILGPWARFQRITYYDKLMHDF